MMCYTDGPVDYILQGPIPCHLSPELRSDDLEYWTPLQGQIPCHPCLMRVGLFRRPGPELGLRLRPAVV